MLNHIRPAIVMMALFTWVLCLGYPLAVTGVAQAAFPDQDNGSLLRDKAGQVVGSALIGQGFSQPGYLHPRPSAAGSGYDGASSSGSNMGPLNPDLMARVRADAEALRPEMNGATIPADAVTASASGLDPHISPAYAELQAARIARARGLGEAQVLEVIRQEVEGRTLGILGQPRVNVLMTNRVLDERFGPVVISTR